MLAMNYRGPYRVRAVANKPEPEILHPNDAIVRVERSCICGSDLHLYHGLVPDTRVGTTFGHEFVGVVESIGPSVENLNVGDHVMVPFNIACGSCIFCQHQLYSICDNTNAQSKSLGAIYGASHTFGGYDGGQAEYVRVPFADVNPVIIPNDIDIDDAALLTDAFPSGYQASEMANIQQGDTVVIFGAGPVGIFAAKSAWWFGAGRVIVLDYLEYRLEFVKDYAQCEVASLTEMADPVMYLKQATDWLGPDVCIDAVGFESTGNALDWAIHAVKKGGTVSVVGVYGPFGKSMPVGAAMNKGVTMRMQQASVKRHIPRLIEHIREGHIKPSEILTHRIPLEEVSDAYHIFSGKLDNCIKTILVPPRATLH